MATYLAPTGHAIGIPGYCWHCDMDVPCPTHPPTGCGTCEYACHCLDHGYFSGDCDEFCREDSAFRAAEAAAPRCTFAGVAEAAARCMTYARPGIDLCGPCDDLAAEIQDAERAAGWDPNP